MHLDWVSVLSTARAAIPDPFGVRQIEPLEFLVEPRATDLIKPERVEDREPVANDRDLRTFGLFFFKEEKKRCTGALPPFRATSIRDRQ